MISHLIVCYFYPPPDLIGLVSCGFLSGFTGLDIGFLIVVGLALVAIILILHDIVILKLAVVKMLCSSVIGASNANKKTSSA